MMYLLIVLIISLMYREKPKVRIVIPDPKVFSQYTIYYDKMFTLYQQLLNSEHYVVLSQNLKWLSGQFLDHLSFTVCIYKTFFFVYIDEILLFSLFR